MSDTNQSADVAEKAKGMLGDLKARASELGDGAARAAKDGASRLGETTRDMADQLKDQAESAAARQKSMGADYLESFAQATQRAAGEFENDLPQAAQYIRHASEQIQDFADTVRESDPRELLHDVQSFARRQPTLFFGGAIVAGFIALRFLKSANPSGGGQENGSKDVSQNNGGYGAQSFGMEQGG
jgi:hypothetical protein